MKKLVLAISMALAVVLPAQAAEFSSVITYNVETEKFSPGIGVGTRVAGFGVGYAIVEFQRNNLVTHAHILALSRDLYTNGNFAAGLKGGTAYFNRQQNSEGWIQHYGGYVSYRLSDDYRVVVDFLQTKAIDNSLTPLNTELVVVGFRYKF